MKLNAFVIIVLAAAGCSKSSPATAPSEPAPVSETATQSTDSTQAGRQVLAAYERIRALLAADDLEGVPAAARDLESSASAAGSTSAANAHYAAIAGVAPKLSAAADLKAARLAFGDVSQHVVALLASDKTLAEGQHVFECPMAAGYKKWVQPSPDLQNPYMGQQMLTCGRKSTAE